MRFHGIGSRRVPGVSVLLPPLLADVPVSRQSLKNCFPEYNGPDGESMPALKYIEQKYKKAGNDCPPRLHSSTK